MFPPRIAKYVLILIAVTFSALQLQLQAQGAAAAPQVVDLRQVARPPLLLSALESCPVVYADAVELPEGLVSCSGAVMLQSGNVAVMDGVGRKLLIFDAAGKLLSRSGRAGQGPGEFSGTPVLFPYRGDSLLVLNRSQGFSASFQIFSGAGVYNRAFSIEFERTSQKRPSVIGASLSDGSISVATFISMHPVQGRMAGLDSVRVLTFDPTAVHIGSSRFAPDVLWAKDVVRRPANGPAGSISFSMSMKMVSAGPVSRAPGFPSLQQASLAVHGGPLYHFEESNDALVVYGPDGRMVRRILLPPLPQQLRPARNRIISQVDAQMLQVHSDNSGRAWVEMARASSSAPRRWWIIDQVGTLVAEVLTPARQELLFAGDGRVLLLRKDDNDVQTVAQCILMPQRQN